jgi:RAB protein geranylgeranyltransferase component A
VIYTRSKLLPNLVSSKVYRQLEFQAVGSWWIYRSSNAETEGSSESGNTISRHLRRVPSSREDIFADDAISLKAKRTLIKFLRSISQPLKEDDDDTTVDEEDLDLPFRDYLTSRFQVPSELHDPILALSLTQRKAAQTPASFSVPRIKRHLGSIGVFGPGFGSLLAKWGGGSEIAQVGCRALAVGGGVYVLNRGIASVETRKDEEDTLILTLSDGASIRSKFAAGSQWDFPAEADAPPVMTDRVARSVSIVSSPLSRLFPVTAEGGPVPAGAVVLVPGKELSIEGADDTPVYLLVHSSDTGECPEGQCKSIFTSIHTFDKSSMMIILEYLSTLSEFTLTKSQPLTA